MLIRLGDFGITTGFTILNLLHIFLREDDVAVAVSAIFGTTLLISPKLANSVRKESPLQKR